MGGGAVRTAQTRRLVARLAQPVRYVELNSDHDLTTPDNPVWPEVKAALVNFAREIAQRESLNDIRTARS
jgi:hypothetical protein